MRRALRIVIMAPLVPIIFLMLFTGYWMGRFFDWVLEQPQREATFGEFWRNVTGGLR